MRKETMDSNIFIIEETEDRVVYETTFGERWEITGVCSACGECEVGAVDIYHEETKDKFPLEKRYQIWTGVPVGQPGACLDARFDNRLDIPVRPEMPGKMKNCTLSGKYLNGN